jgi:hypothetical protein
LLLVLVNYATHWTAEIRLETKTVSQFWGWCV